MASNSTRSYNQDTFNYYYYEFWESYGDPRVSSYPLMHGGPWTLIGIIVAYLLFVKRVGPELMKNREPFSLKPLILMYNIIMCLFNGYIFYAVVVQSKFQKLAFHCASNEPDAVDDLWQWRLRLGWLFTMSKLVDLCDTVFFVLRKNYHQVSTLHVLHHSLVPLNCWLGLKYIPSESVVFFPFSNSFAHCVMYFYYALSTLGPGVRSKLWWKPWVTKLQIVQLFLMFCHCVYISVAKNCKVPKILFAIGIPQAAFFIYMFCVFFYKSYKKKSKANRGSKKE